MTEGTNTLKISFLKVAPESFLSDSISIGWHPQSQGLIQIPRKGANPNYSFQVTKINGCLKREQGHDFQNTNLTTHFFVAA